MRALIRGGLELDAQDDFMRVVAYAVDVEIELDVELRGCLPLEDLRRARIFDRQVLDILGQGVDLRLAVRGTVERTVGGFCLARHDRLTSV